jgi:uncharacterized protein YcaQ
VLDRIRHEGPLGSRAFEHNGSRRRKAADAEDGWWSWKPAKAALEYLWRCGDIAVVRRDRFEKVYDLAERVHPDVHGATPPPRAEHVDWACRSALERLVIATPREIAGFWHHATLEEARRWATAAHKRGEIEPVTVEGVDGKHTRSFALPDWRERVHSLPSGPQRLRLLSPFDPVIRDRTRLERLFGFDYRFEAFVPAPKRQYGYYALPILGRTEFIGRLTAHHDRANGALVIEGVWWNERVRPTRTQRAELGEALERLRDLIGARRIEEPASTGTGRRGASKRGQAEPSVLSSPPSNRRTQRV